MTKKLTITLSLLFCLCWQMPLLGVVDPNFEVRVKFINRSNYGIRVEMENKQTVFDVEQSPVLYSSVSSDKRTEINLQASENKACLSPANLKAIDNAASTAQAGESIFSLTAKAKEASENADILEKELLLRAKHLKEADGTPFKESYWNVKATKDAANFAKDAKKSLELGIANSVCGNSFLSKKISISPREIEGFKRGHLIVIVVGDADVQIYAKKDLDSQQKANCLIESRSNYPMVCSYVDQDGELCNIKLNDQLFSPAKIDVSSEKKAGVNKSLAVIYPFPVIKIIFAGFAIGHFENALSIFREKFSSERSVSFDTRNQVRIILNNLNRGVAFELREYASVDEIPGLKS